MQHVQLFMPINVQDTDGIYQSLLECCTECLTGTDVDQLAEEERVRHGMAGGGEEEM